MIASWKPPGYLALKPLAVLLSSSAGSALLAFAIQLLLTRALSIVDYGRLVATLALINLLQLLCGYGVGWFWLQVFGCEGRAAFRWVGPTIRAMAITLVAGIVVLAAYMYLAGIGSSPWSSATPLSFIIILVGQTLADSTSARLQLEERFIALGVWQTISQVGRCLVIVLTALYRVADLAHVAAGYAIVALPVLVVSAVSLHQMRRRNINLIGHNERPSFVEPMGVVTLRQLFVAAAPYSFTTIFYLVYSQGVVAITERLAGPSAAATYNAAFLIVAAIYMVPSVVYAKYLIGKMFRWWVHDRNRFVGTISVGIVFGGAAGVACMFAVIGSASFLTTHLFGSRYLASVPVLMLLAVGIPIRFVQHAFGAAFFSEENMKRKVRYIGIAALCCIFSSLLLIPPFGALGAAGSAVISEFALLALYVWGVARHLQGVDLRVLVSIASARGALTSIDERESASDRRSETSNRPNAPSTPLIRAWFV